MGENFTKLKKKALLGALLKCAVCGVSFGVFAAGTTLLVLKLVAIYLAFYYYVAIGVAVGLLCGGLSFIIFKPRTEKFARQLDKKYGLNEKVQTALAFADEYGDVIEVQREDAEEKLASLPKTGFSLVKTLPNIWQYIVIVTLSFAIALSALLIPAKYAHGEGGDGGGADVGDAVQQEIPFELTGEHLDALDELIENVKDSDFGDNLKDSVVTLLTRLENNLFVAEWVSEVNKLVNTTIDKIDALITAEYSYVAIASSLADYNLYKFARVIADAVRTYRKFRIVDYSDVQAYKNESYDLIAEVIEHNETGLPAVFDKIKENKNSDKGDNTPALVYTALVASKVPSSDSLYQLFFKLAKSLSSDEAINEIQFEFNLEDELDKQAYLRVMKVYVINALTTLFDLPSRPDPDFAPEENGESEDENDKTNEGGYGSGDWKNNYQVYDPRTGLYGNYMEILEDYFALVDEMLRSPDLSEAQKNIIDTYFQILFSGAADANKGGN